MAKWKDKLAKLSPKSEQSREAAFEAEMMALVGQETEPSTTPAPPSSSSHPVGTQNSIAIILTEDGRETTFTNLESVPLEVRQRIVAAWLGGPKT